MNPSPSPGGTKNRRYAALLILLLAVPGTRAFSDPLSPSSPPPEIGARSAVLADAVTGTVLFAVNPDIQIPPASLTKLMTVHLVLREIAAGRAHADEVLVPPPESWARNQEPHSSLMFLDQNQRLTLGQLLLGMAVPSGNDAATAAALRIAPSVEDFVSRMNAEGAALGLSSTRFTEPAGVSPDNKTTAADFAAFCSFYMKEHPEALETLHSVPEFSYPLPANVTGGARTIVQNNHNPLLGRFPGADGLKTGYIPEAGYNIAATAKRGSTRLVAVVLGADSDQQRTQDTAALLSWGFDNFSTWYPVPVNLPQARIWKGKDKYAELEMDGGAACTVSKSKILVTWWEPDINGSLQAPLAKGAPAGTMTLKDETGILLDVPLVLKNPAPAAGFWKRFFDGVSFFFYRLFGKKPPKT
ncbi:MAG: D-alanyl-D-alanine carboxypeptidase [Treponema sp.]|jgi:D-alanyl-D-alanine carboxypeptidase (penicillin-binding protein 5/6)|nr:D-alanyl-D-alanine carboxypeptidase [Treponema sp.]